MIGEVILPVLLGYLLGSISFSFVIVWLLKRTDIRTVGSGNAGATNVLRICGPVPAVLALLLDAGKGAAAILAGRALDVDLEVQAAMGVAAVIGHLYPLFFGFRGGKGVATAAGTLGLLAPLALLICFVIFLIVVATTRYVSLGSVLVALAFPAVVVVLGLLGLEPDWRVISIAASVVGALIVFKHRENIGRLVAGTESKIGQKASVPSADGEGAEST